VQRLRGDYRHALRSQQQALQAMDGNLTARVDSLRALTEVGLNLQALGQREQAAAFLEQALKLSRHWQRGATPDYADVATALGRARLATGDVPQARALLDEAARVRREFKIDPPAPIPPYALRSTPARPPA
jgi:tetratricopeptide (TPR) repeat protein